VKETICNNRDPFGIPESWDIWVILIEQLKKKNDLLADTDEMPETGNRSYGGMSSSDNQPKEGS
jgi:hypothetical protein